MKTQTQIMEINVMLKHLCLAMKYCNIYADLKELVYNAENETVEAYYFGYMKSDGTRELYKTDVNVACDSNSAMISDVVNRLNHFFS